MQRRPLELWRVQRAVLSLLLSSGVCLALLVMRALALKSYVFRFIPLNLVLAWIPMLFAFAIYALHSKGSRYRWLLVICTIIWFLFYPNAPYLVTDMVHIQWQSANPPWFDLLLMMTLAWTGLLLGNTSLYLMQDVVVAWRGRRAGWLFAAGMLALGSAGVYAGRFWRWNSGDVLHPLMLASKANNNLHVTSISDAAVFLATFFAFSSLTYATLYTFVHLRTDSPAAPRDRLPPEPSSEKPVAVTAPLR